MIGLQQYVLDFVEAAAIKGGLVTLITRRGPDHGSVLLFGDNHTLIGTLGFDFSDYQVVRLYRNQKQTSYFVEREDDFHALFDDLDAFTGRQV